VDGRSAIFQEAPCGLHADGKARPGGSPPTTSDYPIGGGFLDIYGLLFDIGGGRVVNFWSNGDLPSGVDYGVAVATSAMSIDYVSGGVTVQEPGSLTLLAAGIALFGAIRRRTRRADSSRSCRASRSFRRLPHVARIVEPFAARVSAASSRVASGSEGDRSRGKRSTDERTIASVYEGTASVLTVLNTISAILALLAAAAWIRSSRVVVIYDGGPVPRPPGSLPRPALLYEMDAEGREVELIGTLRRQSKWNGYAAMLAAAAAFFQALVLIAPVIFTR
jgi:hypothetical protein